MTAAGASAAAARAYGRVQRSAIPGRLAEAEAFARAAWLLSEARGRPDDRLGLAEALAFNQKLWTLVQAETQDTGHPAPDDVKHDLVALARFMDRATAAALEARQPRLSAMIDVNESLARGLFKRS